MTSWQSGELLARADTPAQGSSSAASSMTVNTNSNKSTVTLSSQATTTSEVTSKASAANSFESETNNEDSAATSVGTQSAAGAVESETNSATSVQSGASDDTTSSGTTEEDKPDTNEASSATGATNNQSAAATSTGEVTSSAATDAASTSKSSTTDSGDVVNVETNSTNPVTASVAGKTVTNELVNDVATPALASSAKAAVKSRAKLLRATTDIASGSYGTSDWVIDSDGVLHIQAGTFRNSTSANSDAGPWTTYSTQIKTIVFEGKVVAATRSDGLFASLYNVTTISNLDLLDVSQAVNMKRMFYADRSLSSLDVSSFDTSNVTNMTAMFGYDTKLSNIDFGDSQVSKFKTNQVIDMSYMFASDPALTSLDVSMFDTSAVTNMSYMFINVNGLQSLDVSNFDTRNVTDMSFMFAENYALENLRLGALFDTSKVTNMSFMFYSDRKLNSLDVSHFDTSQVTTMREMFDEVSTTASNPIKTLDLSSFDTSKVTDMSYMFATSSHFTSLDLSSFNTENVTTMEGMFMADNDLETITLGSQFLTDKVTTMYRMFGYMHALKQLDVSHFDTSKVTSMGYMFYRAENLSSLDVSNFDTSNVTDMTSMFAKDDVLESLDLSHFNMLGDKKIESMLSGTTALKRLVLGENNVLSNASGTIGMLEAPTTGNYTGYWLSGGDVAQTAANLMANYDGSTMADTYIWQVNQSSLTVKDTAMVQTGTNQWSLKDNFVRGTDVNGNTLTSGDVTITAGSVDTTTPGVYTVTYTYQDKTTGVTATKDAQITIIASQVSVKAHDTSLIQGQSWTSADNLEAATDATGQAVDLKDVVVTGEVDSKTPGTYPIVYRYTDEYGNQAEQTIQVTVVASLVSVKAHDTSLIQGQSWQSADNLEAATNATGQAVDLKDVTVTSAIDVKTPGTYPVTYRYTDEYGNQAEQTIQVIVVASQVSVEAHDTSLIQGQGWTSADNLERATDAMGNTVDLKDVMVTGAVDSKTPGTYAVTYRYTDEYGNPAAKTIQVTVVASKVSVEAHDISLIQGQSWQSTDNLEAATDATGDAVDLKDVMVTGTVDSKTPGTYSVVYRYTDAYGNQAAKTIQVTVVASKVSVKAHDTNLIQGQRWTPADSFEVATDATGKATDFSHVTVTGTVDPEVLGTYEVTYHNQDAYGNQQSQTIHVVVVASRVSVEAHDTRLIQGQGWTPADNLERATDAMGKAVDAKDVKVIGTVDSKTPGMYSVTYRYTDAYGNQAAKTIQVVVVASQVAVAAQDSTLIQGQPWTAADNFVGATDAIGTAVDFDQVSALGTVNTKIPGNYNVTYKYTDLYGNQAVKTIQVTVAASQVTVNAKNSTLIQGQAWTSADNFASATDATGQQVNLNNVMVTETVDTKAPGTYDVTYSYTDQYNNQAVQTVQVTVVASKAAIKAKDSTLIQGQNWTPANNFASATDATGRAVPLSAVTVTGNVATKTPGAYEMTYSYTDQYGNLASESSHVTVLASQVNVKAHDTTLIQGQEWSPAASFIAATDATGQQVSFSAVAVAGEVNPKIPGTYTVTYSHTDLYGNHATQAIQVTVVPSQAVIKTRNVTLKVGQSWTQAAGLVSAQDATGQPLTLAQMGVTGVVNIANAGVYPVTYSYTDAAGNLVSAVSQVTVVATPAIHHGGEITDNRHPITKRSQPGDVQNSGQTARHPVKQSADQITTISAAVTAVPTQATQRTTSNKSLPQTDERANNALRVMGTVLLGLTGLVLLAWTAHRRKD